MYLLITIIRNFLFDCGFIKTRRYDDVFVLCVGNIRAGGTGKTPMIEYLIRNLQDKFPLAVVSLGYKRKTKGLKEVLITDTAAAVGDEPKQMKEKFPLIPFFVNKNRNVAIDYIRKNHKEIKLILLDDAYQYRKTTPDMSVLLTEYSRPYFKDRIIPYGRLRERRKESKRADCIVVTKCHGNITAVDKNNFAKQLNITADQKIFFSKIQYIPLIHYYKKDNSEHYETSNNIDTASAFGNSVIVTGIDNPDMIKNYIDNNFIVPDHTAMLLRYPDHHYYTDKDIGKILHAKQNGVVFTTDKDAVKLKEKLNDFYILRIENVIDQSFITSVCNAITDKLNNL